MNKLVNIAKVPIIIGPASSSGVLACAPIANRTKTVILSSGAASPNITEAGDYVFRNRASGAQEGIITAKFAYEKLGLRKMAIFKINTDYGIGFANYFKQEFSKLGGEIIADESFNQGDTDFRSQISKLKRLNVNGIYLESVYKLCFLFVIPEVLNRESIVFKRFWIPRSSRRMTNHDFIHRLYLVGVPIEVGNILKQSYELGFRTQFLTNNMESPELIKIAQKAAEGLFFAIPIFDSNDTDPKVKTFVKKYKEKYGKNPDMLAADSYDAIFIVKEAIEKGGYSGESIRNALYHINNFQGVNGTINFDQNGDVVRPLAIKTVKDGKFIAFQNM